MKLNQIKSIRDLFQLLQTGVITEIDFQQKKDKILRQELNLSEDEQVEALKEFYNLKTENIITEEEYELVKSQVLSAKEEKVIPNNEFSKPVNNRDTFNQNNPINDPPKSWTTTLLLCIFLGGLGIHRFYTGHTTIGVIQILTAGGCGIWWLVDIIMILTDSYKDKYGRDLIKN